jgi:hypothetical protein
MMAPLGWVGRSGQQQQQHRGETCFASSEQQQQQQHARAIMSHVSGVECFSFFLSSVINRELARPGPSPVGAKSPNMP